MFNTVPRGVLDAQKPDTKPVGGVDLGNQTCALAVAIVGTAGATATTPTEALVNLSSGAVQSLSPAADVYFTKGWFYPVKTMVAGLVTVQNTVNINIGKTANNLPDVLQPTDAPILIEAPAGQKFNLKNINIKGTAGDGVFYSIS